MALTFHEEGLPMMVKRLLCTFLALVMVWTLVVPAVAKAQETPLETMAEMETIFYGFPVKEGSLITRLESLEQDLYGRPEKGALLVRIERIRGYLDTGGVDGSPLKLKLAAVEWMVYQKIQMDKPLLDRLKALEQAIYGEVQPGPIQGRVRELMGLVWGGEDVTIKTTSVPKETLVKIRLEKTLSSGDAKVNDPVPYVVVSDVVVDNKLIIPAGTKGVGSVVSVAPAARLGRDGKLQIDFGQVTAIDGTSVPLNVSERSTEENKSLQMAAGASMLGVILLAGNPIGLAGALLVKGKDVTIDKETEFYVEVEAPVKVNGLVLSTDEEEGQ